MVRHQFNWSEKQKNVLQQMEITFDFSDVPDDDVIEFVDIVGDYLQRHGIGDNDELNETGQICEDMLYELAKV